MDEMMNGQDAVNEEECCTASSHGRKSHHQKQ